MIKVKVAVPVPSLVVMETTASLLSVTSSPAGLTSELNNGVMS